ncbi:flagellin lysine-N-methylase [Clostridium sp. 19966]|uniref:flagellin lysine-N-methylase n=1 Tax=Clostridium sp. 19966 TaxID=2768166 RepID=UPI0028DF9029|nr:flagellin lysine-N-methylase [Clostridium sp. 19966]MDT8716663.1 flagellin lysine-N-methylase [Clostridium sp. 19966]
MKKIISLKPQYMKQFQCTGAKCEDNCCYGWRISLDESTYKKYKRIPNVAIGKNITRNRSNPLFEDYGKIKLKKDGYCPFFEDDKLCGIQKQYGVGYLSNTCMTYPRITNVINGVYEKSLVLSCPEATKLILFDSNIMEFDEEEESADIQNNIIKKINADSTLVEYFWKLRIFTITLIQNRQYSVADRLIILGIFMKKIQECLDNKEIEKVSEIIESFNNIIEEGSLKESLENIPTNLTIQMELMKEFNDGRFSIGFAKNSQPYIQCVAECLNGIEYTEDAKVEEIAERYKNAYINYFEPFFSEHEYILENYIVNHVFGDLFPIESKGEVFDAYIKLVINYSLVKMLLIGMSAFNKKLDEALIVRLVYSYSRAIEHNKVFFNNAFNLFKEKGYNTMPYMSILIKN